MGVTLRTLTQHCYEVHKEALGIWQYGEPVRALYHDCALCVQYDSGRWFHYQGNGDNVIWW